MKTTYLDTADSPAGPLHIAVSSDGALTGVWFGTVASLDEIEQSIRSASGTPNQNSAMTFPIVTQISEYTTRTRTSFDIPIRFHGSEWETAVWNALLTIPYGETRSYGQIAAQLGQPSMARAVGWANHINPIPLVIPCHRVIGAARNLTGFGGGIEAKIKLLAHEGAMVPGFA
jgi:methylated-DNA-[protein]-cysteine S-methyltransferase